MPVRKSRGRRRGIRRGLQRQKLRSSQLSEEDFEDGQSDFSMYIRARKYFNEIVGNWGQKCFKFTSSFCHNCCLTPVMMGEDGRFQVASFWRRMMNSVVLGFLAVTCLHKLIMTTLAFTVLPVGTMSAVLSYTGFQLQFTSMCTGIGLVFLPFLSCELLNSWNPILRDASARLGQSCRSPWSYSSSGVQVLSMAGGIVLAFFAFPAFSFIFTSTPIFLFPFLKLEGIIHDEYEWSTQLLVYILCYMFDVIVYAAVLILMGSSTQFVVLQIGFLKALVNSLR